MEVGIFMLLLKMQEHHQRDQEMFCMSDDYFVPEKCQKLKGAQKEQDLAQTRADQI